VDSVTIGYTGEQWRNGGNTAVHTLAFDYKISATPFASPVTVDSFGWTGVSALNFLSPTTGATAAALDGNLAANRTAIAPFMWAITINPGEEIFLRWLDIDDTGNDHGLAVDDLVVTFTAVPEPSTAVLGGLSLLGLLVLRRRE
jgi:hypothetical protein